MLSSLRPALLSFVLTLSALAQVDPFAWVASPGNTGAPGVLGVFDGAGSTVNSFSLPAGAISVAKTQGPSVWVLSSASLQAYDVTGPAGMPVPVIGGGAVVTSSLGEVWTFIPGGLFTPGLLHRRDAMGNIVQTFAVTLATSLGMQADPFGGVWLVSDVTNSALRYTSGFAGFSYIFGPLGTIPLDWELDSQGRAWILTTAAPGQPLLLRLTNNGGTDLSMNITTELPTGVKVDGCGRVHVLRTLANQQQEIVILDDTGATVGLIPLPSIAPATRELIALDPNGRPILRNGNALEVFDGAGAVVATLSPPTGTPARRAGDATGLRLLSVIDRGGDGDLDGVPNGTEFEVGGDPTSILSPLQLTLTTAPMLGASFGVNLMAPTQAGFPYLIGGSGATTGIPVSPSGPCPRVPLAADPLLSFWFAPANPFVTNATGLLDVNGSGTATVSLPADPALSGFAFFVAGVTVDPMAAAIAAITAPLAITLP